MAEHATDPDRVPYSTVNTMAKGRARDWVLHELLSKCCRGRDSFERLGAYGGNPYCAKFCGLAVANCPIHGLALRL